MGLGVPRTKTQPLEKGEREKGYNGEETAQEVMLSLISFIWSSVTRELFLSLNDLIGVSRKFVCFKEISSLPGLGLSLAEFITKATETEFPENNTFIFSSYDIF